jgi:hypothetical protein
VQHRPLLQDVLLLLKVIMASGGEKRARLRKRLQFNEQRELKQNAFETQAVLMKQR